MEKLLPIQDLFKKSFSLYKPRLWTMMVLGLISWGASMIIFAVFGVAGFTAFAIGKNVLSFNLVTALLLLVGALLVIIVNVWIQIALMYAVKEEHVKTGAKDLLLTVHSRMASYYWVVFLRGLITLAGFILFIIPGIIFSVWFCFAQYAFVFEDTRGMKALYRSRELVKGYWWPVMGRLLLLLAVTMLISSIAKLGFLINSLFTMPFGIIYIYAIYEDLKRVKNTAA